MLTVPTKFEMHRRKTTAAQLHTIVEVSFSSETLYFSDVEMILPADGTGTPVHHVWPLLVSHSGINQQIDFHSRRASVGNVQLTFTNLPFDRSGTVQRLSDYYSGYWSSIIGTSIKIYITCDPKPNLADSGLLVFEGICNEYPKYDGEQLTLAVEDISAGHLRKKLPLTRAADLESDGGLSEGDPDADYRMPIIKGDLEKNTAGSPLDFWGSGDYMVRGYRSSWDTVWFVADHAVKDVAEMYVFFDRVGLWFRLDLPNIGGGAYFFDVVCADGVTRTYFVLPFHTELKGWLLVPPSGVATNGWSGGLGQGDYNPNMNNADDAGNAYDRDNETLAHLYAGNNNLGMLQFSFDDIVNVTGWVMEPGNYKHALRWRAEENPNCPLEYSTVPNIFLASHAVMSSTHTSIDLVTNTVDIFNGNVNGLLIGRSSPGDWDDLAAEVGWLLSKLTARFPVEANVGGNYKNEDILRMAQAQLEIYVTIPDAWSNEQVPYFALVGEPAGSEIAGRNPAIGANDLNSFAGYQIERLLRQTIGLTAAQIDGATFDDAYRSHLKTRARLHEDDGRETLEIFLQEMAENSTFTVFFNASGKTRLISFDWTEPDYVPGTPTIISWEYLARTPKVFFTSPTKVINRLTSEWQRNPGANRYNESDTHNDAGSQLLAWGIKEADASFKYYIDAGTPSLQETLIKNGALFPYTLIGIEIEIRGAAMSHLEIGDPIQIDATSVDPQFKLAGVSWTSFSFVIIDKGLTMVGVKYRAVRVPI